MASGTIAWRLHLRASPEEAYEWLATASGRARFWAEAAPEEEGRIVFTFLDGTVERAALGERVPGRRFELTYFGSPTRFELASDGKGGCDLTLRATAVPEAEAAEVAAGWVSVLMAMKAAIDFGVDLRTHDPDRSWRQGYVNQ